MTDVTLDKAIENAEAYKQIDTLSIYLWDDGTKPWEYVSAMEQSGLVRLGVLTSVRFKASHPCGLDFCWSVNLGKQEDAEKDFYEIDTASIEATRLALADNPILASYEQYLRDSADAIMKRALIDQDHINRELAAVALIRRSIRSNP
ncbi:hypothetical protein LCGC14_1754590 [marine sediment metagenome]|uniref:Uncharacterized protein n=1 Tax=marine sediment metagenome TaxID=412755 RepID=A0A0F9JI18_9ZZZZ